MRALVGKGISATTVRRAVADGQVLAISRGVYRWADDDAVPDWGHLAEAILRAPRGLICLGSAAEVHGLGDLSPAQTWVAVPHGSWVPQIEQPPTRFVRWADQAAFEVGVERRTISGVEVGLTNPARTVVDMLRYMHRVGEESALSCLGDYLREVGAVGDLGTVAEELGVARRLSPYLRVAAALGGSVR